MHERQLRRFRDAVRSGALDFTLHALDEAAEDRLSLLDLESCVLTGRIAERQRDWTTAEWKYVIDGRVGNGARIAVVVKWLGTDRRVFLTVYKT